MRIRYSNFGWFFSIIMFLGCSHHKFSEEEWHEQIESVQTSQLYEKHQESEIFFNPWLRSDKGFGQVITWKLSETLPYTEEEAGFLPKVHRDAQKQILDNGGSDFILWIGHGSFLIKTGSQYWLLDPMFSKRALLAARKTPPALTAEEINKLFPNLNVVISHNHYDHLDEDSIEQLSEKYVFYVPKGLKKIVRSWQPKARIIEMDWWQTREVAESYEIHCLPAQHWSHRVFGGRNTSLWASFMIITPKTNIYFGGDSGYFIGYREFGKKYSKIDYALIPTTAYHPRWFMHEAHMNSEEAIQAFQDLGADYFIPTQWGTFSLADEPAGYPGLDLIRTIKEQKLDRDQYLILDIGQLLPIR